jgi:hypothetical protein
MLDLQKRLPSARVYRFDNGTAYAIHSVQKALVTLKSTGNLTESQKCLHRLTYGNEGWPDLMAGCNGNALGIEIKIGKDKQRESQKGIELAFQKMGWGYYVFTDQENYKKQLEEVCQLLLNRS